MRPSILLAPLALLLTAATLAGVDDFQRERGKDNDAAKDALEDRLPPALVGRDWMNVEASLTLEGLRGKVVLLKFWGTW